MINNYYMPTRVIMGKDCISQNSEIFTTLGKKAMIVTGANSAKINGSESEIIRALNTVGISYLVFDKVMSNPTISCVYEGASIAKINNVDFIIAVGGGSPMDAGKAIALLAAQEIDEENLFSGDYEDRVLPMVLIPTTAGTGSEVTQYSILTNDKAQTKTSIATSLLFPSVSFLDPKYMRHLPIKTTIHTTLDALSHAVEGMLSVRASILTDSLASKSISMIMGCFPDILEALNQESRAVLNMEIRESLLQASFIAGMVIAQTGTTVVHSMGYSLTYFRNVDHGRANGLLLGEYLGLVEKKQPSLVQRILKAMNLSEIQQFKELIDRLLGEKELLSGDEIQRYGQITMKAKNIANCAVIPSEEEIREMFKRSLNISL